MIEAPSPEFLVIAGIVAVSTVFGVYMARPHSKGSVMDQFSFDDALTRRDEVLADVAENSAGWMADAIVAAESLPLGELGTGEDIRARLLAAGLRAPRHPNVWGALFNTLTRRGSLVATGEFRPMRSSASHGRSTRVYAKVAREAIA